MLRRFHGATADGFDKEQPMRKYILSIAAVAALAMAEPAMAYDSGDVISMQDAMDVATDLGLATVSHTQFLGDEWQIEGRDPSGRWMEVYVDANTGEVRGVNRGW
jgi:peptidase YpeB-like protein